MKKVLFLFASCLLISFNQVKSQHVIPVFDAVLFYDGYNTLEALADEIVPLPEGFYRLSTSVITTKLSEEQLNMLYGFIQLNVVLKAACDNYDRLGHVNIAFVPKDSFLYDLSNTQRIEIARFVTPFMNKNKQPDTVPYTYQVDYLQHLFQDKNLREQYDFWLELDVFGVPYAANTQVAGCKDRSDTFYGTLWFTATETATELENEHVFLPLFMKNRFNNYQENATDTIGKTIKTKLFAVEENLTDAHLVLITSNHGANSGGEEYNRRWHYVYVNGEEVLAYRPGRTTCEPFRVYNTQANGIYGTKPRTDEEWQSFSNWCPGDVIDTRIINLGALQAGEYLFKIEVPNAVFVGQQGNFPLSLYFQGKTDGILVNIKEIVTKEQNNNVVLFPNPANHSFSIKTSKSVKTVMIYTITGQKIFQQTETTTVNINSLPSGLYIVSVELENGQKSVHKMVKQ
ncbi:MAG: T9SS type A sorting domain-containing protein [Bacteroidetes bacterium]|nr:T9SS type A sorting domain-containing protein [Bacteroidota bacterium]MCL2302003.1 T9SS type A sorting domain-containing protein [Lentimicrobiaceae bacterium]